MITVNVLQRVFRLKYQSNTGTCFSVDVDGNQYFVTARHVLQLKDAQGKIVSELSAGNKIEIFRHGRWVPTDVMKVKHSEVSDVSVFVLQEKISAHPMAASMDGVLFGQDLYFLGFPYGTGSDFGALNGGFPVAFIRKGILSASYFDQPGRHFFIDGHNNPGFSGGPVVFKQAGKTDFQVCGIIHGYHPEYNAVGGNLVALENTNSSIVIAYSIDNAVSLIEDLKKSSTTSLPI